VTVELAVGTVGARLRALRLAKGLTQEHLARRAGFSDAYISKLERSAGSPPSATVLRLAQSLEVVPDALVDGGAGGKPGGAAGRREILSAAIELFSTKGYTRTSIRELAARAGCSTANLYHHFSAKYEIFVTLIGGVMDDHFAGLDEALRRHDDPVEQLRHVLHNHLMLHMTRPEVRLLSYDFFPITGAELEQFIDRRDRYERGVRAIVQRGVREGAFDVEDPAVAVRAAMAACTAVDRWFSPSGPLSAEQVARRTSSFLLAGFCERARRRRSRRGKRSVR
jgi:AcrR family transcriptional regulator